jgi:hypothetical protein
MNTRRLVLSALLALTLAGPANASTASVNDGRLTVRAAPGETNDLKVEQRPDGYFLYDSSAAVTPAAGCVATTGAYGNQGVVCSGVSSVGVELADRDDVFLMTHPIAAPLTLSGGRGRDLMIYRDTPAAIDVSTDGGANDGPSGQDNIKPDVERLFGTEFADTLRSGPLGGELGAGPGDDTMTGGPGDDTINAAYVEDVGIDAGYFYAQGKDEVTCGRGRDLVLADHEDDVARDCEVVAVDNFGASGNGGFSVAGSRRSDVIGPLPFGWGPSTVRAYGGNDTIRASEGRAYGGKGNDRIIGADRTTQEVYGNAGRDRIDVRDKHGIPFSRDVVRCGPGSDLVYANFNDRIADDCEHVSRR